MRTDAQSHVAKVQSKFLRTSQNLARRDAGSHLLRRRSPDHVMLDTDERSIPGDTVLFGKRAWDVNVDDEAPLEASRLKARNDGVFDESMWTIPLGKRSFGQSQGGLLKRAPVVELRDVVKNPKVRSSIFGAGFELMAMCDRSFGTRKRIRLAFRLPSRPKRRPQYGKLELH